MSQVIDLKEELCFQSICSLPIDIPMAGPEPRPAHRQWDLLPICFTAGPNPRCTLVEYGKLLNPKDFGVPNATAAVLLVTCL
jgi:hypothetical protein